MPLGTCNMQRATCSMQHATCSMQHRTRRCTGRRAARPVHDQRLSDRDARTDAHADKPRRCAALHTARSCDDARCSADTERSLVSHPWPFLRAIRLCNISLTSDGQRVNRADRSGVTASAQCQCLSNEHSSVELYRERTLRTRAMSATIGRKPNRQCLSGNARDHAKAARKLNLNDARCCGGGRLGTLCRGQPRPVASLAH